MLVIQNALRVPLMSNNLIPPFIMRENGIIVNECAKIHCEDPTREDDALIFKGNNLRIPLQLHGIFSYFVTRKPDVKSVVDAHEPLNYTVEIYTLTPMRWNPHMDTYALNEESIVDWEGNIRERNHCDVKIVLDEISDEYQNQYKISSLEAQHVDEVLKARSQHNNNNMFKTSELSTISSTLCPHLLNLMIEAQTNLGSDAINIDAMNCYDGDHLDNGDDAIKEDEIPMTRGMSKDTMNELESEEDMDAFCASGVHGGPEVGIEMLDTYPRYGESYMRMPNEPSMQLPNMVHIILTQL